MPHKQSQPSISPLQQKHWEPVEILERLLFPDYPDKFDRVYFCSNASLVEKVVEVIVKDGIVFGFLCVAPLTSRGADQVERERITTIKDLPDHAFQLNGGKGAAYFLEVIAAAPWANQSIRDMLTRRIMRVFRAESDRTWYACPASWTGLEKLKKMHFLPLGQSGVHCLYKRVGAGDDRRSKKASV